MDGCSAHMWRERGSRKVANNCARCAKASKRGTAGLPCPAPALPHSTEHTKTGRLRGHANTWSLGMGAVTHCVLNHYACLLTSRAWRGTARPAVHQQWRMSIARVSCTKMMGMATARVDYTACDTCPPHLRCSCTCRHTYTFLRTTTRVDVYTYVYTHTRARVHVHCSCTCACTTATMMKTLHAHSLSL